VYHIPIEAMEDILFEGESEKKPPKMAEALQNIFFNLQISDKRFFFFINILFS
jgi:hypothetical protein